MLLTSILSVALLLFTPAETRPLRTRQAATEGLISVPLRRVERNPSLHPEIRHQIDLNHATRIAARAAGLPNPPQHELLANLHRRAEHIQAQRKRYSVLPAGFDGSVPEFSSGAGNQLVAAQSFQPASNTPAVLTNDSSEVDSDGADTSFVMILSIGSPSQDYKVIVDSGSSVLWLKSGNHCVSQDNQGNPQGCGNHKFLDSSTSSSLISLNDPFNIVYGSGSASGSLVNDTVVFGGILLSNYTFGLADKISNSFASDAVADGLMGTAKSGLVASAVADPTKLPTPIEALVNSGTISQGIASYALPRLVDDPNGGEITFGGMDPSKFDASTAVTVKSSDTSAFWVAQMDGVTVNGATISLSHSAAILDTGTTIAVFPTADAAAIHAQIPGAVFSEATGSGTIPCNTTASVAVQFGGKSFPIDAKDLLFASFGKKTGDCTSGIGGFNQTQALLGGTFLKSVYMSTNIDDNSITLAQRI
ncbi:unnamed protein product [Mycena citricolor]|uniref:Peptidase A1 domain-containing protein n=1 Tax=Mycena citricolor TaxID=2018698 RepID=A0AAD2HBP5_9AGAR|nr:unnamed protein product [Mycena citricolor]